MSSIRVDRAALAVRVSCCALALALGIAGTGRADATEGAVAAASEPAEVATIGSAESIEIAQTAPADPARAEGIAPVVSAEVAAVASAESAASAVFFEDAMPQGPSVAERLAIIREKIQQALEYPPLARLHASDGDALVRFEVDHSGVARDVRVVRSSGHQRLDDSALRAVQEARPLPWVYGPLEVPVHFELIE